MVTNCLWYYVFKIKVFENSNSSCSSSIYMILCRCFISNWALFYQTPCFGFFWGFFLCSIPAVSCILPISFNIHNKVRVDDANWFCVYGHVTSGRNGEIGTCLSFCNMALKSNTINKRHCCSYRCVDVQIVWYCTLKTYYNQYRIVTSNKGNFNVLFIDLPNIWNVFLIYM